MNESASNRSLTRYLPKGIAVGIVYFLLAFPVAITILFFVGILVVFLGIYEGLFLLLLSPLVALFFGVWGALATMYELRELDLRQNGHCLDCGYDLRASRLYCPECGRRVAS